ncbi:prepilin-type N-terminal cleavage/methylation domain-containing protein [Patescibacteria group bacterium]|nr:prepilin-type N-terminal cleavage/methylation domain-containing protein [Patescibacteria group bacterium]
MRKGFTLLEIMVAVAIMLIISGLSLAGYVFSMQKSRDAKRKGDLSQIARALEVFNEDFGEYPAGSGGKIKGCGNPLDVCVWGEEFSTDIQGTEQMYMSKLPSDPKSSLNYYYESDGESFGLYAVLENNKDKDYQVGLAIECATGVPCNYLLTEYGVEAGVTATPTPTSTPIPTPTSTPIPTPTSTPIPTPTSTPTLIPVPTVPNI